MRGIEEPMGAAVDKRKEGRRMGENDQYTRSGAEASLRLYTQHDGEPIGVRTAPVIHSDRTKIGLTTSGI